MDKVYRIFYTGKMPPPISIEDTFFVDASSKLEAIQIAFYQMGLEVVEDGEYREEMGLEREGDYITKDEADSIRGDEEYHEGVDEGRW